MTGSLLRLLRSAVVIGVVGLFFAAGCSHQIVSPSVKASQVQPDLVCNAQLQTGVVIHGSGFTPMPSKVVEKPAALILPSVSLYRSALLDGTAQKGPSITLSGDPTKANADHLSWQNSSQMTASVDEALKLQPGLYDVTVTNPDGKQKADIKSGLAVVPPPSISDIKPPALCDDQADQQLILDGKNFLKVGDQLPTVTITGQTDPSFSVTCGAGAAVSGDAGADAAAPPRGGCTIDKVDQCTDIPGRQPPAQLCSSATITIAAGTLAPGKYSVTLTNPDPAGCHSTESITLTVNPPPRVDSVAPSQVCSGGSVLDVTGANFQQGATAELDCCPNGAPDATTGKCQDGSDPAVTPATSVDFTDAQHLTVHFGAGVNPGDTCNVVVQNPDTCQDRPLPHKTVQGVEGPILFYVDPPVAYNQIATRITLYLTSISGSFTVTLTPSAGTNCTGAKSTTLSDAQLVAGRTNRIQATVPKGLAACQYDVSVTDSTGCSAVLPKALNVVGQATLKLTAITPPFGQTGTLVPVQITGSGFTATPRAFLNQVNTASPVAVQLEGVTMVDTTHLTAVVPKDTPVGDYQLIVVNPTGEVGVLGDANTPAYQSLANAPPDITGITPQSIVNQAGQQVTVNGSGFNNPTVTLSCQPPTAGSAPVNVTTNANCTATSCAVTFDASTVPDGSVCVIKVTNSDGSYAQYSALGVTNSSLNLQSTAPGTNMNVARRALLSAAVSANNASRYVYAIGGDGGQGTAPLKSVEFANVDLYGTMSAWTMNKESLGTARSFLAGATVGRYIYAIGGTDGTSALDTAERALVLSPAEIPHVEDIDLCLSGGSSPCFGKTGLGDGLDAGAYAYRISAVIASGNSVNLGGETLASDPTILKLPSIPNHKISVKLTWSPPMDDQGAPLAGIQSYRIYRTPKNGVAGKDEVLLDTVPSTATLAYIDDGTKTLGTEKPLPPGSTSSWQPLPNLSASRRALASLAAQDPNDPSTWYVYAFEGDGAQSYEYLPITVAQNGRETVAAAWKKGASNPANPRSEFGAWLVTSQTTPLVSSPDEWVFLGGGTNGANIVDAVEAAKVQQGGDLGNWTNTLRFKSSRSGYAAFVAGVLSNTGPTAKLYEFAGALLPGHSVRADAFAGALTATLPNISNWNNEGLTMQTARNRLGTSIQSAFVFFLGGESTYNGAALKSTESLAW